MILWFYTDANKQNLQLLVETAYCCYELDNFKTQRLFVAKDRDQRIMLRPKQPINSFFFFI
jgi:hypothetical protein